MMINKTILIYNLKVDQQFRVEENEKKTFVIFLANESLQNGDLRIIIEGKKAEAQILGVIIGEGGQRIELNTLQDHKKPESVSDLLIKSVLFDKAKFYYKGLIKIEKNAQKSNAYQKNQNLLMSKDAWADSRPYLEILANDVRCTHGATVGKIDENQLYYLGTRGIGEKDATKLLISGFFQDVLERIDDKNLQEELSNKINSKVSRLLKN